MVRSSFRQVVKLISASAFIVASGVAPACSETQYTFGVVPQFEARRLSDIWVPILDELERRTGLNLTMVGSPEFLISSKDLQGANSISPT